MKRIHFSKFFRNKRNLSEYYEYLYANKCNNLNQMVKFLDIHLSRLNHEEIETLYRTIMSNTIESVKQKLPTLASGHTASLENSTK